MTVARPVRLGISIALGLVLAAALGAQSAGIALTKKAPDTAIAAFPLNGLAYENIASAVFLATTEATGSPEEGRKGSPAVGSRSLSLGTPGAQSTRNPCSCRG